MINIGESVEDIIRKGIEKVERGEMINPELFDLKISDYQQVRKAAKLFQLLEEKINTLPNTLPDIELKLVYREAQRTLDRSIYRCLHEKIFGVPPSEYPEFERRLNEILENLEKGIFTLEDAETFIKLREELGGYSDNIWKVRRKYFEELLAPVHGSIYGSAILEVLAHQREPISYRKLLKEVQKILSRKFNKYDRLGFDAKLDTLTKSKITRYPLVKKRGILFNRYELTEEGKIAYHILKDSIAEALEFARRIDKN